MNLQLERLSLLHFKNYSEAKLDFGPEVNCLTGNNGAGKTNVLDAIYYLSHCKSYFNPQDAENIRHGEPFFVLEGEYKREKNPEKLYCAVKRGEKKVFRRNKKEYTRLADHIGLFPCVIISPADADLVHEGSEVRRKFLDRIISQFDSEYLDSLLNYNRILQQRNNLLKYFSKNRTFDPENLAVWNEQLVSVGYVLFEKRTAFVAAFIPLFDEVYGKLTRGREHVAVNYESQLLHGEFHRLLEEAQPKERLLERTGVGPHKDDLVFEINEHPIKRFGSQGQQKSFLIALKLAEFLFVRERLGITPILLLDDVFDKIDDDRVSFLMQLVTDNRFGQIFITDTHKGRVPDLFRKTKAKVKVFEVDNAQIQTIG